MLTCVIIDDEQDAIEGLSKLLENFIDGKIKLLDSANNLLDGIEVIKRTKPDIVFLDIDMPGEKGINIYKHIRNIDFYVVFTTAYEQYAIDAIKNAAVDYLLKPINFVELNDAINKIIKQETAKANHQKIEDKINILSPVNADGIDVIIPTQDGFEMLNTRNVEYCEADGMYSKIHLYSGNTIIVSKPLKALEDILPEKYFYRTHQSYLINIQYIRRFIRSSQSTVILKSGVKVPIATRKLSVFTKDIQFMLNKININENN
jgi:two-component system LytT family response regulator